jgi:hypothetical protein
VKILSLILCFATLGICEFSIVGCHREKGVIHGNEGLRLTPEEIQMYTHRARAGDPAAAKKLWHHYEFVEYDHQRGEYWEREYDRLQKIKEGK